MKQRYTSRSWSNKINIQQKKKQTENELNEYLRFSVNSNFIYVHSIALQLDFRSFDCLITQLMFIACNCLQHKNHSLFTLINTYPCVPTRQIYSRNNFTMDMRDDKFSSSQNHLTFHFPWPALHPAIKR